jgi:hypothetical protein
MEKNAGKSGRTPRQKSASRAQSSAAKNPSGKLAREGGDRRIQSSADRQAAVADKAVGGKGHGKKSAR